MKSKKISIVDYNNCNIGSVINMLRFLEIDYKVCISSKDLLNAEKILLPGVGSFDEAMKNIKKFGFEDELNNKVLNQNVPILGICIGMQLITNSSEEGNEKGLGWINAETKKLNLDKEFNVPHMGWNTIQILNNSPIVKNFNENFKFYFVHSYHVELKDNSNAICKTPYGININSIINFKNIFAAQFHPEKSHKYGMQLFKNFAEIEC